mmetsp:Transcript_16548/g.36684  ORF Transcript_16548/g.36684 Transcript_16548/m.36684 type:complete len:319 (-) Transcript_16548:736-1692(-)
MYSCRTFLSSWMSGCSCDCLDLNSLDIVSTMSDISSSVEPFIWSTSAAFSVISMIDRCVSRYPSTPFCLSSSAKNSSRLRWRLFKICSVRCSTTSSALRPDRSSRIFLYFSIFSRTTAPYFFRSRLPILPPCPCAFSSVSLSSVCFDRRRNSSCSFSTSSSRSRNFFSASVEACRKTTSLVFLSRAASSLSCSEATSSSSSFTCSPFMRTSSSVVTRSAESQPCNFSMCDSRSMVILSTFSRRSLSSLTSPCSLERICSAVWVRTPEFFISERRLEASLKRRSASCACLRCSRTRSRVITSLSCSFLNADVALSISAK